jgi:hypothetical protein
MKPLTMLITAVLAAALVAGCAEQPAPQSPAAAPEAPEITRDVAINMARYDASLRYGHGWITYTDAQKLGRYWVVELRSATGQGLRYAISKDGAIKQRNMVQ